MMRQKDMILRHMREIGEITPMDALRDYGCMRLGARIYDLRREGHEIKKRDVYSRNRFGSPTHWAAYRLEEEE